LFTIEDIVKNLGVSPKELRELADKMDQPKCRVQEMSEDDKMRMHIKSQLIGKYVFPPINANQ